MDLQLNYSGISKDGGLELMRILQGKASLF